MKREKRGFGEVRRGEVRHVCGGGGCKVKREAKKDLVGSG